VAMSLASGTHARWQARGCDGQLTEAWTEYLGVGRGQNFIGGQRGEEQRKGMSLRIELGPGSARCWAVAEKTARDPFPIF
jgi:hypothetical protein